MAHIAPRYAHIIGGRMSLWGLAKVLLYRLIPFNLKPSRGVLCSNN
jgi:hypothetical protein